MKAFGIVVAVFWLAGCAAAPAQQLRTVTVSLKTPNPCWEVELTEIYRAGEVLFAVSELHPPRRDMACAQVIATVSDHVTLILPALPVRHLVLGQTWDWGAERDYETLVDRVALEQRLAEAQLLYRLGENETRPGEGVL